MEHVSPDIADCEPFTPSQSQHWGPDNAHVRAWNKEPATPFRFEALEGNCEPKEWGKPYPQLGAAVEKYRKLARGRALTADETRAHGQAVGVAMLQRRELCGDARLEIDLRSTCVNKSGRTQAANEAAYERWLAKLAQIRAARAAVYQGANPETVDLIAPAKRKRRAPKVAAAKPALKPRYTLRNGAFVLVTEAA